MHDAAMRLLMSVITLVLASLGQAHAQQDSGSANDVLPLCKTWLKVAVEGEVEEVGSIVKIEPIRADHFGNVRWRRARRFTDPADVLACPANSVSNEQLVRMVVAEIEKHPEQMSKNFSVLASEVIMAAWPCKKYGDPIIVPARVIQPGPFSFCLP